MKFTLSWLKEHLKTKATVEEISTKLSAIGLEVEGVDDPAEKLGAFRIARIVEAKKHPNADKLQLVQVEVAKGEPLMEVVCGAPNARAGMLAVFAPLGTYIPGSKITLEKKPVRGVISNGMMCSAAELELAGDSEGKAVNIKDNLYAEARMEAAVNFDNLHFVLVLVPEK